jgi:four helix bundle protein
LGEGHRLTLLIYEATSGFPPEELYGLVSQLRRCSASVSANVAEGCGRSDDAELNRFRLISMGPASEPEHRLLLAHDLGYLAPKQHRGLSQKTPEVKRMLSTSVTKLRHNPS